MTSRPGWVSELLSRPLPPLTPPKLSDTQNPPYRRDLQNAIADLKCHPALESALHLMNDDLFAAHFLLRKMQEDEWGKWLHAILHQTEGDLEKNAKLWYQQVDPDVLRTYWGKLSEADPCAAAVENMYAIMRIKGGSSKKASGRDRSKTDQGEGEMEAERSHASQDERTGESEEERVRQTKWDELVSVMLQLEERHGWGAMDGTEAYTRDEDAGHKSMVLGEGYRTWDRSGYSER